MIKKFTLSSLFSTFFLFLACTTSTLKSAAAHPEKPLRQGSIELICGPMFAGKTEEVIRRLKRAEIARQGVLTLKHSFDNARSLGHLRSHSGDTRTTTPIPDDATGAAYILELGLDPAISVIGIDEIQFFPKEMITVLEKLRAAGKRVIVAGLDCDFRNEPFGIVPHLMAIADTVNKLHAVCMVCGGEAQCSQRLIGGKPAKYDDPIVLVGAEEAYQPRCRECFVCEKPA